MIQPQSYLAVADNTGAKKIMCIRILGGNRHYAKVGDIIIGVIKEAMRIAAYKLPIKTKFIVKQTGIEV